VKPRTGRGADAGLRLAAGALAAVAALACPATRQAADDVPLPPDLARIPVAVREPVEAAAAACRERPRDPEAFTQLGRIYHGNQQLELAARCYARALELGTDEVRTRHLLGLIELERGGAGAAAELFGAVLRREPRYAPAHHALGRALLDAGRAEEAIAALQAAVTIDPGQAGYHATLGRALRQAGRLAAAEAALTRALELDPEEPDARHSLALTLKAAGRGAGVPERHRIPARAFAPEADVPRFTDVASELGLDRLNLAGGVAVEDYDLDGLLDIVVSTSDPEGPLRLLRNRGGGGFEDRSAVSRLDDQLGGLDVIAADHDGDGDSDLLALRGAWLHDDGRIRMSLLSNAGDGTFEDVTRRAGLAEPAAPTQAAAWGDFDGDGDLDLYVAPESRRADGDAAGDYPARLFIHEGDGTFRDRAREAGVTNDRYARGVAAGDYDNDGDLDLFVSNIGAKRLYRNDGNLKFTDVAGELGLTEPRGRSFACWFFDYDNDGWLDLFVAGFDAEVEDVAAGYLGLPDDAVRPALYRNLAGRGFDNVARRVGLDRAWLPMGANFGDVDHDGWLDIYLGTGDPDFQTLMPNVLLRNDAGRRFQDVTAAAGVGHLQKGHGVAFADLDQDGDQDLVHQLGGFYPGDRFVNALFRNPGGGGRFLVLQPEGRRSPRSGHGARVRVTVDTPAGPRRIHRAVGSVSSFGGSPARQEIGLGDATRIVDLEIDWPGSSSRQVVTGVPLDARIRVVEGQAGFERLPYRAFRLGR